MPLIHPLEQFASDRVMVLGGGIAGIQAALDLAAVGLPVTLVEAGPAVGGLMVQLDKTFPTNDCAMCIISPRMLALARHPLIEILTLTEVSQVQGQAGDFHILLSQRPRYVDLQKCSGCGECTRVCPVKVADPYNAGLNLTKAIHVPFPQAVPRAAYISSNSCLHLKGRRCEACVKACKAQAIDFHSPSRIIERRAGVIILGTGVSPAAVANFPGYNLSDVVTSLEFERLLSATGPHGGKLIRPSDQTPPRRLAFVQCVGSRDAVQKINYCSSICCMASLKQALAALELSGQEVESTIFYMDIRAQGKGFERYLERARERGVRLIRSRVNAVDCSSPGGNPRIQYTDSQGKIQEEEFSMAILAAGLRKPKQLNYLAALLKLNLNEHGFIRTQSLKPGQTSRSGLLVAGSAVEPLDIAETVTSASAAAAAASQLLSMSTRKLAIYPNLPVPKSNAKANLPLRIGIFLCHCGTNIAKNIQIDKLSSLVRKIPGVAYVTDELFACSMEATRLLSEAIQSQRLSRVIVAACSPLTHEELFRGVVAAAGLNPGFFIQVNIREQCSWVHTNQQEAALEKAWHLIKMAVARAGSVAPIELQAQPVIPRALIVGGGIAGMSAALNLADQGFHAYIIERTSYLGGLARRLYFTLEGADPRLIIQDLEFRIYNHPNIEVLTRTEAIKFDGSVGQFQTQVRRATPAGLKTRILRHGVTIIATGGKEYEPQDQFEYGADSRVLTQLELEAMIGEENTDLAKIRRLVMMQCVGSREPEHPYCSRLCCSEALKNSLLLKNRFPYLEITILYRDLRAYGFRENYYLQAKQQGVSFLPFEPERPPRLEIPRGRPLKIWLWDSLLQQEISFKADLLILSAGIEPAAGSLQVSRLFNLVRNPEGFFMEAHQKLRPVEMITKGIFLCGLAHSPKSISESISQAGAAASKAAAILFQEKLQHGELVAQGNAELCRGCLHCLNICPYGAIFLGPAGKPKIKTEICQGCGLCAAECPARAINLSRYNEAELQAEIEALYYN